MNSLSATHLPIPSVHQSGTPWLARLDAGEVFNIDGAAARRWLCVQNGSLWVTAACGVAGPVPRDADIWLSAGDSLELPPGTAWLLQAWPTAEMVLLEQAAPQQAWALKAGAARQPLTVLRNVAQRFVPFVPFVRFVRFVRQLAAGTLQGNTACTQRA